MIPAMLKGGGTRRLSGHRIEAMQRRIAILVETSHGSGRDLVSGVGGYIRESGCDWLIDHETQRLEGGAPIPKESITKVYAISLADA